MNLGKLFSLITLTALASSAAVAAPTGKLKYLVLDPITYQKGVDKVAFEGIDELVRTALIQSQKYQVVDREQYGKNVAREQALGLQAEIIPAEYSIQGEVVQLMKTGKSVKAAATILPQYLATVSLRLCDLKTQVQTEAETLRVTQYCQTPKDMLVYTANRVAFAILTRDFPIHVRSISHGELKLNYGGDFLLKGDQFEIRRKEKTVDTDTGKVAYDETVIGYCQVIDTGKDSSSACLLKPCDVQVGDVLKFYRRDVLPAVAPPPPKCECAAASAECVAAPAVKVLPTEKPRIAVAPFISKRNGTVNVNGLSIGARQWMDDCVSHINTCLDQRGSFHTLDRSFGPEIDRELARIQNEPNANLDDICRLSQKLSADYLVVAEVVFYDVVSSGPDFSTGLPLPPPNANFAEVRYRVVNAPTTELAGCSGTYFLNASCFGGTAAQVSSASAAAAATYIVDKIQAKFDPDSFARLQSDRAAADEAARKAAEEAAQQPQVPVQRGVNLGF